MRRRAPRAVIAAGLLTVALAALLIAWFLAGWADVRSRQQRELAGPAQAADELAATLARALRAELTGLMDRELERPYFHYQNLMRDPRASGGVGVTPSPLATGSPEPLVRGFFQLDASGRATTPTINDDVPALSEPKQLAGNTRFRDEVVRSLADVLRPPRLEAVEVAVAEVTSPQVPSTRDRVPRAAAPPTSTEEEVEAVPRAQVVTIDRDSYLQNNYSNSIYQRQLPEAATTDDATIEGVTTEAATTDRATSGQPARPMPVAPRRRAKPPPGRARSAVPVPVTITVSPLAWRTELFDGVPTLLAVRQITTPDGALSQGFVVEHAALASWLADHAGDAIAALTEDGDAAATEIAAGWHLTAQPSPRRLAAATAAAATMASTFVLRFALVGLVAALAAALVVVLIARAERLARERSQFAAAAAHELRTPLAGLQLYGDMLADGLGDPAKQRDYARRMAEEAARLGRVVSNVLGFSQLERGNLSVDPAPGRLDAELKTLALRAEPALDRAGASLALDLPELTARFDRDALARIVGNLLDNAEKYGRGADDRTIALVAREVGSEVEVTVTDHGPGISAQARATLFRPFQRGVAADGPAGLGLGLALSQSLARAMGGELACRTGVDGGASFVLRLPRQ